jgi:hypothetical protein
MSLLLSLLFNDHHQRFDSLNYSLTARKISTTKDDNHDSHMNDNDSNLLFAVTIIDVDCNLWRDDSIEFTKTLHSLSNDDNKSNIDNNDKDHKAVDCLLYYNKML